MSFLYLYYCRRKTKSEIIYGLNLIPWIFPILSLPQTFLNGVQN
ncbi:hypothetical protein HOLDEFILI_01293 [Holdemania filiformis DSM 12042]|uniref:Uncharacterized protein n=1 Tax=Holdemania filiformis DSM 12042 TaxID=545696 RepID=B9Y661_9FIRM|nr:hypothetical protein HOLDEFILI_01293 [Holdemania filiformis DSM 12042]